MFHDPGAVAAAVRSGFAAAHGAARVLVFGDVMLDRYIWGDVSRISPEAPVPIVRLARRSAVAGGAANVAMNARRLGCHVRLVSAVGDDAVRDELRDLLAADGIDGDGLIPIQGFPTIVKTRIIGGHQHMLRLDDEDATAISDAARARIAAHAVAALADADVVILSDYAKGLLAGGSAPAIIAAARARGIPVLVDPKGSQWERYRGATTITPNTGELAAIAGVPAADHERLISAGRALREALDLRFLTFTRGEHGICLIDGAETIAVPAMAREVFDVSGAGDTVIATMAAGLACGLIPADAMRLANLAAGIVVGKLGTVPIARAELETAVDAAAHHGEDRPSKIMDRAAAAQRIARWRAEGDDVVFTNGCFDVFHAGHVAALEAARRHGQRLVVGLNSDDSVRRLKGPTRPINSAADRAAVLAAMACVDAVVEFAEDTPLEIIVALRPQVLVKGADYKPDQVVGAREVASWGGRVALVPLLPGRSTTAILAKG